MGNVPSYVKEYENTKAALEELKCSHNVFVNKHSQLRQKYTLLNDKNNKLLNDNNCLKSTNAKLTKEIENLREDNHEYSFDISRYMLMIDKMKDRLRILNDKTLLSEFIKENNNIMLDDEFEKQYLETFLEYLISKMHKEVEQLVC